MNSFIKKMTYSSILMMTISNVYAQSTNESGYYASVKVATAEQKADNMETSLRPGLGRFIADDDKETLTYVSLAWGYDFGNGWRTEGEYTIKNDAEYTSGSTNFPNSLNHHKIESQRLMLNAYRDFEIVKNLAIYGNIGLGVARVESSGWQGNKTRQYLSNTDNQLVYSLGAGATYKAIDHLNVDLGYRYVDLGKADSGLNSFGNARSLQDEQMKAHVYSSEFYLGLRYLF